MSLVAVLEQLDRVPVARGAELASARALAAFCAEHWPSVDWRVEEHGNGGANLVASHGPVSSRSAGRLLCSHLDTTLDDGLLQDYLTGPRQEQPLRLDGDTVTGFGLGVARAPAAAALLGFARATAGTLLLAGSGTHRREAPAAGLADYLARHGAPASAVIAKASPPGVLREEPGMVYLSCVLRGRHGAALGPGTAKPRGGMVAQLGTLVGALNAWTAAFAKRPGVGQVGRAAGLGAVRSGSTVKPDLLPGAVRVDLCLITCPGDRADALAEELRGYLRERLAGTPLEGCIVELGTDLVQEPSRTDPGAEVVTAAADAWQAEHGAPIPEITGWTGATDAGVLRAYGVPTVRIGPQLLPDRDDATRETASLGQLETCSRIYTRLLCA